MKRAVGGLCRRHAPWFSLRRAEGNQEPLLAEPDTLALAMTETLTEALALTAALPATVAQAIALPLWLPMSLTTAEASLVSLPAASTSIGPWICAAATSAGRFF